MSLTLLIASFGTWIAACAAAAGLCAMSARSDRRGAAEFSRHVAEHRARHLHGI